MASLAAAMAAQADPALAAELDDAFPDTTDQL
jgi:hypothetical protein